ncbi:MAG: hypothetical protein V8S08_01460 [Lachnoclostridium sp.]
MLYTIPDYYKEFHCTANNCEHTCCAGWQIVIDRKALNKYRKVAGRFEEGFEDQSSGARVFSGRIRRKDVLF